MTLLEVGGWAIWGAALIAAVCAAAIAADSSGSARTMFGLFAGLVSTSCGAVILFDLPKWIVVPFVLAAFSLAAGGAAIMASRDGSAPASEVRRTTLVTLEVPEIEAGLASNARGDDADALIHLDKAIALGCGQSVVFRTRGLSLQSLGWNLDAIKDFDRAIELDPHSGLAYFMRCVSKYEIGDLRGALADIEEAVRLADEASDAEAYQLFSSWKLNVSMDIGNDMAENAANRRAEKAAYKGHRIA